MIQHINIFVGINNDDDPLINNDVIKPLSVILPQMNGYIKYFDNGGKNMSFVTDDEKVYEKYDEIWNVVKGLLKLKFTVSPIRDDKYILAKLKIFRKKNITSFNNNNIVFLDSTKLKIVWKKITTFFKRRVLIIL